MIDDFYLFSELKKFNLKPIIGILIDYSQVYEFDDCIIPEIVVFFIPKFSNICCQFYANENGTVSNISSKAHPILKLPTHPLVEVH